LREIGEDVAEPFDCSIELSREDLDVAEDRLVGLGLVSTQGMVEMHCRHNDSKFAAELNQRTQKRHGIRPSGHRYTEAISGLQPMSPAQAGENLVV